MIERLLDLALRRKLLVVVLALLVAGGGTLSLRSLPVDAFPDVTPTLVQVLTEAPGLAPEEVENLVTYPVEAAMNGLPGVEEIKSVTTFGLSVVNVYFEDRVDVYFARQLVTERLPDAAEAIPPG
ncbi:MAG TPA: efflux RND transporter permease subunit, partial [Longimicrobiales bacterium]|nr:efflux RND transporter permease subunit [Longimicrobiales bacterium]